MNVRTYVTVDDKPGVWFFSLDAASLTTVRLGRASYHLPYYWARKQITTDDEWIAYLSRRREGSAEPAAFGGRYRRRGLSETSPRGSLKCRLIERYCLSAADRAGRLFHGEINHSPWPLQPAEAEIEVNTMAAVHGIALPRQPLLHFARRLDVVTWPLQRIG